MAYCCSPKGNTKLPKIKESMTNWQDALQLEPQIIKNTSDKLDYPQNHSFFPIRNISFLTENSLQFNVAINILLFQLHIVTVNQQFPQ